MELLIGIITKPQGIKGELKLKDLTDGGDSLCNLKEVYIHMKVTFCKVVENCFNLKLIEL